jgi:ABC-type bacteriocin/lantibiotic exporter with double-glycine peptidase domain
MNKTTSFKKLSNLISSEKKEVSNIYVFAILSGIIQLSLPLGVQSIIGFVLSGTFSTSLMVLISLVIAGVLSAGLLQIQQMKIIEKIQQKIFHKYAFLFKKSLLDIDLKQADDAYLPEIMNRFLDVTTLQKGLSKILLDIPIASIQIILGILIVAIYHPLFLILVLIMLIIIVVIFYITTKKGLETSIKESSYKYETTGWLEEMARLIHHFKIHRSHPLSLIKMDEKVNHYLDYRTKHFNILLFQFKNLVFLKIMITATMLFVGTYLLINQQLNVGQFVAAEIIILTMISSVEKIIINLDTFYDILTSLDKLHTIEKQPIEMNGDYLLSNFNKGMDIEFAQVNYAYLENNLVFDQFSFKINAGEKIAIVGKDGSGKSTLLRLCSTLYKPSQGSILMNQIPLNNLNLDKAREHIGIMFNRLDIFSGTITENIAFGNSSTSFQDIIHFSKLIGLEAFINELPFGMETVIDTTGKKLPRSVIKKILILRAIVNQPALILLEEPFSDLEQDSIELIEDTLLNHLPNSTVLVVSNEKRFNQKCNKTFNLADKKLTIISNK